jgi:hypothetical protein
MPPRYLHLRLTLRRHLAMARILRLLRHMNHLQSIAV